MTTKAPTEQLLALEHQFWDAMKEKDASSAKRMTDEDCIVVGAQGVSSIDPAMMARMLGEGKWTLDQYTFDPQHTIVRMLTDDVALVAYQASEQVTVEGKPLSFDVYDSSVWIKRGDAWKCAMHTESLAGDPFGRDRVKR